MTDARDEFLEAYREFIREMTLRFERAMRAHAREMREDSRRYFEMLDARLREEIREHNEQSRRRWEAVEAEIRDQRDERRAHTEALLSMLDRLDNGGTAPAT